MKTREDFYEAVDVLIKLIARVIFTQLNKYYPYLVILIALIQVF